MDLMGSRLEGRLRWPAFLGHRVPCFGYNNPVGRSQDPRLGQPDGGVTAQADVPAAAVNHDALRSAFRPGRSYVQVKTCAVTVSPGYHDRPDLGHSYPPSTILAGSCCLTREC